MKAQTSLMLIVVLILVFIGLAVFLLSFASTLDQQDYFNLYTNNMIITVMRSDTGYHDSKCRLVSDAVSCAFFSPQWRCGGDGPTCTEVANDTISRYIESFELIQQSYRYLYIAKPEYLSGGEVLDPVTDQPLRIKIGDLALEAERVNKLVANQQIQKTTSQGPVIIRSQLILSRKQDTQN